MQEKKPRRNRTLNTVKKIVNVRAWLDYDRLAAMNLYLVNGIKALFVPKKASEKSSVSFDDAIREMNLTPAMLKKRAKGLYRLSFLMSFVALLIFIYTGYNLYQGYWAAAMVSFVIMGIAVTMACRYHFWYYQIKVRRLGCTFQEWFYMGVLGKPKP